MARSTLILALVSVVLAGAIGAVAWRIIAAAPPVAGKVEGTQVALGLPDIQPASVPQLVPARSAIAWNAAGGTITFQQNAFLRLPIASLTKLMTAMVALDHGINWDQETDIQLNEYGIGGQLLLQPGERVTMRDLFTASLLGSANNATLAYVRALGLSKAEFVQAMNRKAVELNLEQTTFTDVTGLDKGNISTAYEVARLAQYAFTHYPDIARATSLKEYSFVVGGSGREHTIHNTNKLVSEGGLIVGGSKTGFLYEAEYCLVVQGSGRLKDLTAVVLGSPSEAQQYQGISYLLDHF